ncbi:MAG TPA: serine protease [Lacunisphaera sp.]|nr:serine protease [Lacunisphaera sp.]
MALLPKIFLESVVAIGTPGTNNIMAWIGTGFVYGYPTGNKDAEGNNLYRVYLVTNKHVIDGQKDLWMRLNPEEGKPGQDVHLGIRSDSGESMWHYHKDPSIDLAVTLLNLQFLRERKLQFGFVEDDNHVVDRQQLKDGGLTAGDPVYVLGFPLGRIGKDRLYAVCRGGIVARCSEWIEGRGKEILVDATVFPGNSGGPVFAGFYFASVTGTKIRNKSEFIGVVQSYIPYTDVAISQQTRRPRITFEENSGLTSVIPADFLRDIIRDIETKYSTPPKVSSS